MVDLDTVLRIPAKRSLLSTVRDFIALHARAAGLSGEKVDDVVLAVDELVTNMIVHGYQDGPGEIEISFSSRPDSIAVCLRDRAPLFDSTQAPEPDLHLPLELRSPGGLGLHLVRQSVDRFVHRTRPGGGNELTIEKHL